MKLYHGTNIDFEKIDIAKSKPNKDFGRGFYLSADYKQAQNMANIKFEQMETGKPLVQEYSIDEQEMQNLGAPDKPCGVGRADANPKLLLNDT